MDWSLMQAALNLEDTQLWLVQDLLGRQERLWS
jgi:hypothetical protein